MLVLGVETSCDETSVSIVLDGKQVLSNVIYTQIDIHKVYGGVVPEVASRHHLRKITRVFDQAFEQANVKPEDIDLVAVTSHPGLIGSLLVGINAAKTFALAYGKKCIEVDGEQHEIESRKQSDIKKDEYLSSNNWIVLRISYKDLRNITKVKQLVNLFLS